MPDDDKTKQLVDPKLELEETRAKIKERIPTLTELIDTPEEKRGETWASTIEVIGREITALNVKRTALLGSMEPERPAGQGPTAATRQTGDSREHRSLGQQVVESDAYKQWRGEGPGMEAARHMRGSVDVEVRNSGELRATITGPSDTGFTSGGVFAPIMPYTIAPLQRRDRLVVRDLLSQSTTQYEVINYINETYVSGSDADVVAEGASKPEVAMNWARVQTNVKKIAAWVPATNESLADYGQLRGAIDNRLQYKLKRREESELLSGDGTGAHQLGLLHATNLKTQAFDTSVVKTITQAIAQVENVDGDVTGIVMNPTDFWAAMAALSATLTGSRPFDTPPDSFWGLPCVRTPRIAVGTALVGDFKQAAEIFDREDVNIRVGDQHSDFFIKNLVAILAEERLALVIYRGDLFVSITSLS